MKTQKTDGRKLDAKTLQYLRKRAVTLRGEGISNIEVAKLLGVNKETTSKWYAAFKRGGEDAISVKKTGRPKKSGKILTDMQERTIIRLLIDTTPEQLKFKFALWTREAVQAVIDHTLGIKMPLSTVGYYLAQWHFSSKKPIKRAYERKEVHVKQWLEEEYPHIKREAKKENASIWWADETACVSLPSNLKGYAPIGSKIKPILLHTTKKFKVNMISAITPTGKSMFALYDESIATDNFIDFLEKVIRSNGDKKVYMIVDNLRVHHAKKVKAWEEEHKDAIKLFYLPPYCPEFNPDEYLNQDYKSNVHKYGLPKTQKELKDTTNAYMLELQNHTQKVANFFKHPSVQYAS